MSTSPRLEDQIAMSGISYGRRHDISYRIGLIMQVVGLGALAVLYPLANPFYTLGIMLFEVGALLSATYLLVWMSWIKKIILGSVLIGLPLQIIGSFAPEQYAGSIIIAGIGFVCVGAAGMAGKEAYCFSYREGWMLMWLYPIMVLANLLGKENRVVNSLGFSALFILLLSLVGKKLRQPILAACKSNVCGGPQEKSEDRRQRTD